MEATIKTYHNGDGGRVIIQATGENYFHGMPWTGVGIEGIPLRAIHATSNGWRDMRLSMTVQSRHVSGIGQRGYVPQHHESDYSGITTGDLSDLGVDILRAAAIAGPDGCVWMAVLGAIPVNPQYMLPKYVSDFGTNRTLPHPGHADLVAALAVAANKFRRAVEKRGIDLDQSKPLSWQVIFSVPTDIIDATRKAMRAASEAYTARLLECPIPASE